MEKVRDNMIDFIIVNENKDIEKMLEKILMNYDYDYRINTTTLDSNQWNQLVQMKTFKIYILELKTKDDIKKISQIREELDDWQSMIITLTNQINIQKEIMAKKLLIIDCINSEINSEKQLERAIQIGLKNYDKRPNSLKYNYKNIYYNIEYSKILYIEKEQDSKRCIIRTEQKDFVIPINLNQISQLLDKRFIKCNRSFIINMEQVYYYNTKNNIIVLKNNHNISIVSRDKKKVIINYLRGIN